MGSCRNEDGIGFVFEIIARVSLNRYCTVGDAALQQRVN